VFSNNIDLIKYAYDTNISGLMEKGANANIPISPNTNAVK
jgi:hypothetical protein